MPPMTDQLDTLTVRFDQREYAIPIVVAMRGRQPLPLLGDLVPEQCDHDGATWSPDLDLRCPRCGSRLFLPPRHLALRSEAVIETMHHLWCQAGWPPYSPNNRWSIVSDYWTIVDHPLFAHVGGLPVRTDRLDLFMIRLAD